VGDGLSSRYEEPDLGLHCSAERTYWAFRRPHHENLVIYYKTAISRINILRIRRPRNFSDQEATVDNTITTIYYSVTL
jgi:hypothetical protein